MVQIGVMRMLVPRRLVLVPMRVRFGHRSVVVMLVVIIVDMPVFVRERLMKMLVLMPFGEMQPQPQSQRQRGASEFGRQRLPEAEGDQRADKRSQREIG